MNTKISLFDFKQTQALALTRPKSELSLSLHNDSVSLVGNSIPSLGGALAIGNHVDGGRGSGSHVGISVAPSRSGPSPKQQHQPQQQPTMSNKQPSTPPHAGPTERFSPKTNCFNLSSAAAAVAAAAAAASATDDNSISSNHQQANHQSQPHQVSSAHLQQTSDNSASTAPLAVNLKLNSAISTATSPLNENGNGASAATYLSEKFLSTSTLSPSDLRKDYDVSKVNGEIFFQYLFALAFAFGYCSCDIWNIKMLISADIIRAETDI